METLGSLPTAFEPDGVCTAGNSSPMSDGAGAVVLMDRETAEKKGLEPLAVFRGFAVTGCDPSIMGVGPVEAIRKARAKGHRVYLCSGRSKAENSQEIWDIGIDGYIGGNGSYVEDDGKVVMHQLITLEQGITGQVDALIQLPALWRQTSMAAKGTNQLVAAKTGFLNQFVQWDSG
mgnify:CR=1 FL=1